MVWNIAMQQFNKISVICLHTDKRLNSTLKVWSKSGTLSCTNTQGQSGPESNVNEWVLRVAQNTWDR